MRGNEPFGIRATDNGRPIAVVVKSPSKWMEFLKPSQFHDAHLSNHVDPTAPSDHACLIQRSGITLGLASVFAWWSSFVSFCNLICIEGN
ncbi:hypothetical protein SDJN03_21417, partial [Cucurbita argyrosperma subsp. sororia]